MAQRLAPVIALVLLLAASQCTHSSTVLAQPTWPGTAELTIPHGQARKLLRMSRGTDAKVPGDQLPDTTAANELPSKPAAASPPARTVTEATPKVPEAAAAANKPADMVSEPTPTKPAAAAPDATPTAAPAATEHKSTAAPDAAPAPALPFPAVKEPGPKETSPPPSDAVKGPPAEGGGSAAKAASPAAPPPSPESHKEPLAPTKATTTTDPNSSNNPPAAPRPVQEAPATASNAAQQAPSKADDLTASKTSEPAKGPDPAVANTPNAGLVKPGSPNSAADASAASPASDKQAVGQSIGGTAGMKYDGCEWEGEPKRHGDKMGDYQCCNGAWIKRGCGVAVPDQTAN